MLAIARGLMSRPRLLLMDEPSLGLAPQLASKTFEVIESLRAGGTTILMVEQMARQALRVSDRAYVLEHGRIVHEGASADLLDDPRVLAFSLACRSMLADLTEVGALDASIEHATEMIEVATGIDDSLVAGALANRSAGLVSMGDIAAGERDLRDAVGGVLYAGTSDIQRNIVSQMLGL